MFHECGSDGLLQEGKPGLNDTKAFHVAVLNEFSEDGRLDRAIWLEVELQFITHVVLTSEEPNIIIDCKRDRKIVTCEEKNTADYLINLIPRLDMKRVRKVQVKCVMKADLYLYVTPEARV